VAVIAGGDVHRHAVTVVLVAAFTFSFTNVWALELRLGVPGWAAPLLASAVDLSVVGSRQLRPGLLLLLFSGGATLVLNAADLILNGAYGRAAFGVVGPLLLMGWSQVGPGLLGQFYLVRIAVAESDSAARVSLIRDVPCTVRSHRPGLLVPGNGSRRRCVRNLLRTYLRPKWLIA
jgi:hypothetical protein